MFYLKLWSVLRCRSVFVISVTIVAVIFTTRPSDHKWSSSIYIHNPVLHRRRSDTPHIVFRRAARKHVPRMTYERTRKCRLWFRGSWRVICVSWSHWSSRCCAHFACAGKIIQITSLISNLPLRSKAWLDTQQLRNH